MKNGVLANEVTMQPKRENRNDLRLQLQNNDFDGRHDISESPGAHVP